MNCPACSSEMQEKDFGGVHVDVCPSCKGIWFDWLELKKLDEQNEGMGQALVDSLEHGRNKADDRGKVKCPKCFKPMIDHNYQSQTRVTVDECYLCGGFFLDAGELKVIRDNFLTETERDTIVIQMINNLPKEPMPDIPENIPGTETRREAVHKFITTLFTK